jgi:hypothetical protein
VASPNEVNELLVAGARRPGEPAAQVGLLRAGIEDGCMDVGEMGPHLQASSRIEGMRQRKSATPWRGLRKSVLAGRHLDRVSLHDEDTVPARARAAESPAVPPPSTATRTDFTGGPYRFGLV